jgi:hypothetical protein
VIVEGRCRAEALVATKPLDYFVYEEVIQPSRLRTALALHVSKPNIRHKTLKMINGIPTENLQFNLYIRGGLDTQRTRQNTQDKSVA